VIEVFGRYRLDELIGRGGMGEVFRAYDAEKDRVVALKRLPAHLAADADFTARFRRESQVAARLREPHVVPIHDYGEIDGRLFIDMRLVEGSDLAALLTSRRGGLDSERAVRIVAQIAGALDAAHADGLIHRDVKPSNVLLTGDDHVYLADFGIAHSTAATALTGTGATIGTADYMSPERFISGRGDHRVDVYALGCVLHEALTGRKPFDGEGAAAQMYAHVNLPPPRPSQVRPEVPPGFDAVVARAMAKDPKQRFDSAGQLANAARAALLRTSPQTLMGPPSPLPVDPAPSDPWRQRAIAAMVVAAVALLGAGAAVGVAVSGARETTGSAAPTAAPTTALTVEATPPRRGDVSAPMPPPGPAGQDTLAPTLSTGPAGQMGVAVRDGGIEVTVTDAFLADSVELGNELTGYVDTPAGADARFVVVKARVLNDTDRSVSVSCGGVPTAVIDERARKFDPIPESYQARGNSHCAPPLQPGFEGTATWVYRVPISALVTSFVFRDPSAFKPVDKSSPGIRLDLAPA
jgi:Protein kinase domain